MMGAMGSDDWPLVGRDGMVDTIVRHLADGACDGVFLMGAPGAGTTRVLHEVHARLGQQRRLINRVAGSHALREVPFGALAHTIPGDLRSDGGPLDPLELFERLRFLIGHPRTPAHRFVTCVDEVRWLDDASLGLLSQLLAGRLSTVVATLHDDDVLPPALEAIERSHAIRRVVVPPLSRDHMLALVEHALDGPVDGTTAHALVAAAQGVPLHLAEIIDGSIASGSLSTVLGTWTLRAAPTLTPRLTRVFDQRLERVGQRVRELVELVAFAEPVSLDALDAAGLVDAAVAAEEAGLLVTDDGAAPRVRLGQPLLAAHLRARTSPLRRRAVLPRAVELVAAAARPDDVVRLALWRLECGHDVPVDELEQAAALTRAANDFETTEELASAAVAREASVGTLLLQAEALHDLCRFDEADDAMQRAEALVRDEFNLLRLHVVRHRLLLWGRHDADASVATLRAAMEGLNMPLLRDLARSAIANTLVFSGHLADLPAVVAELESGHPIAEVALLFPQAIAEVFTGRVAAGLAVAREGLARRAEHPDDSPVGHPALSKLALAVGLTESGEFAAADDVLTDAYHQAVEQRIPQLHTWLALQRGRLAMFQGRIGDARRWFVEARSVADRARFAVGERIALTGLLVCAGHVRDTDTARLAERALADLPPDRGFLWPERMLGLAWSAVAAGRPSDATNLLLAGADEAAQRGEVLLEAELLYEVARVGEPRLVAARMRDVVRRVDSPLAVARGQFVAAAAARDATGLAQAERRFAALGALLAAAETASHLGRVLHADGRPRDAQGAALRATQYLSGLVPVATPLLMATPSSIELSPREQEIAELAAAGMASKAIALQLGLSVRTVSNHLQNAYLKLGISGRDELAVALGR